MFIESGSLFFHLKSSINYVFLGFIANVANILFVFISFLIGFFESRERIDHEAGDDVTKEHIHEDNVNDVEDEAIWLE